jgi:hypothetical protein
MADTAGEERVALTVGDMHKFEIGKVSGGLYYDNKRVQTESVVVLSSAQSLWAIGVALAAIFSAGTTIFVNAKATFWDTPKPAVSVADSAALAEIARATTTIGINTKVIADSQKLTSAPPERSPSVPLNNSAGKLSPPDSRTAAPPSSEPKR